MNCFICDLLDKNRQGLSENGSYSEQNHFFLPLESTFTMFYLMNDSKDKLPLYSAKTVSCEFELIP